MKKTIQTLMIGTAMAVGVSAIAPNSAQAGSLTNATIGGSNSSDYLVYDADGTNTFLVDNTPANVQKVLKGNADNPTGNIELAASSEQGGFNFSQNTTLTGQIGGKNITLSSLTFADWFGIGSDSSTSYGANNFANTWFNEFYGLGFKAQESAIKMALGAPSSTPSSFLREQAFNAFFNIGGFQRTSDPNISYVNQDSNSGLIRIGLAGHYDLKAVYTTPASQFAMFANFLPDEFQASEVVKYTYNGVTDYLYSFNATRSGLTDLADKISHNGNYEVTIQGHPQAVPEPSVMLGVLGVAGVVAAKRKLKKVSA